MMHYSALAFVVITQTHSTIYYPHTHANLVLCFGNNISRLFYTSHLYLTQKYVGYYWTLGVEATMNYIGT